MKETQTSRRLMKKWHVHEKAMIDHLVGSIGGGASCATARVHSAVTKSGLFVEEQVRKAWQPSVGGLAMF
jgi:hypothetical protein